MCHITGRAFDYQRQLLLLLEHHYNPRPYRELLHSRQSSAKFTTCTAWSLDFAILICIMLIRWPSSFYVLSLLSFPLAKSLDLFIILFFERLDDWLTCIHILSSECRNSVLTLMPVIIRTLRAIIYLLLGLTTYTTRLSNSVLLPYVRAHNTCTLAFIWCESIRVCSQGIIWATFVYSGLAIQNPYLLQCW